MSIAEIGEAAGSEIVMHRYRCQEMGFGKHPEGCCFLAGWRVLQPPPRVAT